MRSQGETKKLIFFGLVLFAMLCLLDLVFPSILHDVKRNLPKDVQAYSPLVRVAGLVILVLYTAGSYGLYRVTGTRQSNRLREVCRQGRTFEVIIPRDSRALAGEMADLLARVWDATKTDPGQLAAGDCVPLGLEYVSSGGKIHCQVRVPVMEGLDVAHSLRTQIAAKYPGARVLPIEDLLATLGQDDGLKAAVCKEMQLFGPAHYPIQAVESFRVDPIASILHAIGSGSGHVGVDLVALQVVVAAVASQEWEPALRAEVSAIEAVTTGGSGGGFNLGQVIGWLAGGGGGKSQQRKGRALSVEEKRRLTLYRDRVREQRGFTTTVRIVAGGADPQILKTVVEHIATEFSQFNSSAAGPQGFVATNLFAFQPGTKKPENGESPAAEGDLSESKVMLLEDLRRMVGEADEGNGSGGEGAGGGRGEPSSQEATEEEQDPVEEAQPILWRMPTPVTKYWPPWKDGLKSILLGEGLATIYHFPHRDLQIPGLVTRMAKHVLPPEAPRVSAVEDKPEGLLILAVADEDHDPPSFIAMPYPDLRRGGVYVLGPAGTGKSVLLRSLGGQFLEEKGRDGRCRGLAVIDAKEDLARDLAGDVLLEDEGDVIWIHPGDLSRPVVINVMDRRLIERVGAAQVVSSTLAVFKKMYPSWDSAVNVQRILTNAVGALIEGEPEPSMINLYAFLQDRPDEEVPNPYREAVVQRVKDPVYQNFWAVEYPEMQRQYGASSVSVRTQVEKLLRSTMTRYLMGLPRSTVDFRAVVEGRIFLAAVPKTLGVVQSAIGALLFNQFVGAGFARFDDTPIEDERRDYAIIVDEFQNFAEEGEDIENLLSMLRAAHVAVLLAHQSTAQISDKTMKIILSNNQTKVIFPLTSEDDARRVIGPWRSVLTTQDLMTTQTARHEVFMSCLVNNTQTGAFSARTLMRPPPPLEDLGPLPAEGFRWPKIHSYDTVVNEMAAWEAAMLHASRLNDRTKEAHCLAQQVKILRDMVEQHEGEYSQYAGRRRLRDQAERQYILDNPSVISEKLPRIKRLSGLQSGIPRAEAEYLTLLSLSRVMGKSGADTAAVHLSDEDIPDFDVEDFVVM